MVYCTCLQRLINHGYVDGELVYLQRLRIPSTMDHDLRFCKYCMKCGTLVGSHDDSNCIVIRNMTLLEKLQRHNDRYLFNLELASRKRERIEGDPNYPENFRMYHCPYCSEHYEYEPTYTAT